MPANPANRYARPDALDDARALISRRLELRADERAASWRSSRAVDQLATRAHKSELVRLRSISIFILY